MHLSTRLHRVNLMTHERYVMNVALHFNFNTIILLLLVRNVGMIAFTAMDCISSFIHQFPSIRMSFLGRLTSRFFEGEATCEDGSEDETYDENEDNMNDSFIASEDDLLFDDGSDEDDDDDDDYVPSNKRLKTKSHKKKPRKIADGNDISNSQEECLQQNDDTAVISSPKRNTTALFNSNKLPGDSTFPTTAWSLTITKINGDIPTEYLTNISEFLKKYCLRGIVNYIYFL